MIKRYNVYPIKCLCFALDSLRKTAKISIDYKNIELCEVFVQIVLVGVDHLSAPIALRERLVCSQRQIPQVLQAIRNVAQECVLLSTCNRMEIYAVFSEIEEGHIHLLRILSGVAPVWSCLWTIFPGTWRVADTRAGSGSPGISAGWWLRRTNHIGVISWSCCCRQTRS